jgi:hypothetical protein
MRSQREKADVSDPSKSRMPVEGGATRIEEPVMARVARLVLLLALLKGVLAGCPALAQTADEPATTLPSPLLAAEGEEGGGTSEPDFLQTFPRPPDAPASLLAPATPLAPPPNLEKPYFQTDPLLDPPFLGRVGWFADVEAAIVKPVLESQLLGTVTFADGKTVNVGLPASKLYWTASPRFEVGYRLPSGFGGISLAYRYLVSEGSSPALSADGPATLNSRLDYNIADLAWTSREYTPWQLCDMRLRLGLRYVSTYFDTQAFTPVAEAMAGDGIYFSRNTASYVGIGPLAGLDLSRRLNRWGLALSGRLDLSSAIGRERQNFFASTTTLGPDGQPQNGRTIIASSQAMPIVMARAGLNWQPPTLPTVTFFAGYQFEYVWHAGELTIIPDTGNFWDQGVVLRAEWNY